MAKLIKIVQVIRDQVAEGKDEITATQFVADNLMNAILGKKISDFQNLWDSLTGLFSRPWVYRIWVVQEAASSAETVLTSGNNWIIQDAMNFTTRALLKYVDLPEDAKYLFNSPFVNGIELSSFASQRMWEESDMDLLTLFHQFR